MLFRSMVRQCPRRREDQALLQRFSSEWQLWKTRRRLIEELPPQINRWGQHDAAVLQQGATAPELSTANAFASIAMNEIGGGAHREAVRLFTAWSPTTEAEWHPEVREGMAEPAAGLPIGLSPLRGCRWPNQRVREVTAVQHRPTSRGSPDQINGSG